MSIQFLVLRTKPSQNILYAPRSQDTKKKKKKLELGSKELDLASVVIKSK